MTRLILAKCRPRDSIQDLTSNSSLNQQHFVPALEQVALLQAENDRLNKTVSKLSIDVKTRETTLLLRLAKKEEEVQNLIAELQEQVRQQFQQDSSKKKLLDPMMNVLWKSMRKEVEEKDERIKALEAELHGVQFTPNRYGSERFFQKNATGKKLIAKIRALQCENEELGKLLFKGRVEQMH
ncbi:hypothetical protein HK096_010460, partial [Nowakowskiella sp. JEL0078]